MRGKKGSIEVQFNWIFVFIVGSLILLFFFSIANRQKQVSESKIASTIITDLEAITTGARVAKGTAQVINTPDIEIGFDCTDCSCSYSIGRNTKQFREKIIFAPAVIMGRRVVAWTLDWSIPFRVVNFLYMTSPQVRYIFLYDADGADKARAEEFIAELPPEMFPKERPMEVYTSFSPTIDDQNNYKVKFVLFDYAGTPPQELLSDLGGMNDRDVSAVNIKMSGSTAELEFYEKDDDIFGLAGRTYAVKAPAIYAAIFAENIESYKCNMQSAFRRLSYVSSVYRGMSERIYDSFPADHLCRAGGYYKNGINGLDEIKSMADSLWESVTIEGISSLATAASKLSGMNNKAQLNSCPEIY